jgi:hypothetical protein
VYRRLARDEHDFSKFLRPAFSPQPIANGQLLDAALSGTIVDEPHWKGQAIDHKSRLFESIN